MTDRGWNGGWSEQGPFYRKKEVLAGPKWSVLGWMKSEGDKVGWVSQRVSCGRPGSLEKVFRDYASGNREPRLVLEQEICVYMPRHKTSQG